MSSVVNNAMSEYNSLNSQMGQLDFDEYHEVITPNRPNKHNSGMVQYSGYRQPMPKSYSRTVSNAPQVNINIEGNADDKTVRQLERSSKHIITEVIDNMNQSIRYNGQQSNAKFAII